MKDSIFLTKYEADRIHDATLDVLEHTGIILRSNDALELLLGRGAMQDREGRILIPRQMVNTALQYCRKGFTLYDRNGSPALELYSKNTYLGPGMGADYQFDVQSGKVRKALLADVGENVRLCEGLGLEFMTSIVRPSDIEPERLCPEVFAEVVKNTARPVVIKAGSLKDVEHVHRISQIASGAECNERAFAVSFIVPSSPLDFHRDDVAKLLYCADNDIPLLFAPTAALGRSAPVTPEGGVVLGNAGCLAGLVIAFLRNNRVRFIYGADNPVSDTQTGRLRHGAAEWFKCSGIFAEMGAFYGMPSWGSGGCSDANEINSQASWEAYRGMMLALTCKSTMIHNIGLTGMGRIFDGRMAALAMEFACEICHVMKSADVSTNAMAVGVIDDVARGGTTYGMHPHTERNVGGALRLSGIAGCCKPGEECHDMKDRLWEKVESVLAGHRADVLDKSACEEIDEYLSGL